MFYSIAFEPREVKATEAVLDAIYEASRLGLKGDPLAYAAGLTPVEYRRLVEFDASARYAEEKGRADSELEAARAVDAAIRAGDAKMALDKLKHQHSWVAKQQLDVNVDQTISITAALEKAQQRVINAYYTEVESAPTPSSLLANQPVEEADRYDYVNARPFKKSTDV